MPGRKEQAMKRAKNATLVFCLFIVYCVLLSQGLKASAVSAFFGALAAVLTVAGCASHPPPRSFVPLVAGRPKPS